MWLHAEEVFNVSAPYTRGPEGSFTTFVLPYFRREVAPFAISLHVDQQHFEAFAASIPTACMAV